MRPDIELYNEALDCGKEGAWADVVLLLRKALQINDSEAEYYSLMGVAYLGLELKDLAIYNFRQAHKLNPFDPLLAHYLPFLNDDNPPYTNIPRSPNPLIPNTGAEAEPDNGENNFRF
jgi:tetratricopeptide (TPR) repeat protein